MDIFIHKIDQKKNKIIYIIIKNKQKKELLQMKKRVKGQCKEEVDRGKIWVDWDSERKCN